MEKLYRAIIICVLLLIYANGYCGVILSENYDSISSTWNCSDAVPAGWSSIAGSSTTQCTAGADTTYGHYGGEIGIGGPLNTSGNMLQMWRKNGVWDAEADYAGYLNYDFSQAEWDTQKYKELYVRFYMRIQTGFDVAQGPSNTFKINRYWIGSQPNERISGKEAHLFIAGPSDLASSKFTFYIMQGGGVVYSDETLDVAGVLDGNWHCYEWRVKLSTNATSNDGATEFWIDGVLTYSASNLSYTHAADEYFTRIFSPGIGNLSTGGAYNMDTDGWYSMDFDEFVLSTNYIGPLPGKNRKVKSGNGTGSFQ